MPKFIRILLLLGLIITASIAIEVEAASSRIDVLHVDGVVNPVLVDYIERGIEQAEDDNAIACIIQLDTPGGLVTSMLDIVEDIVNARVPIVVYISPAGAWAASAGTFITMAAHVAAMAPATNIGAAHPVTIDSETEMSEAEEEKTINIIASKAKTIAELQGRNAEWAEKAVRESASATEREALELNVIDMIAVDLDSLVSQLDGRQVTMLGGNIITLHTQFKGGPLFQVSPWLIATVVIIIAAIFAFVVSRVIRAHRRQASTGREELIGKTAVVRVALEPEGTVFFKGESWTAISDKGRVEPGEAVIITRVDGLKLYVIKKE